MKNEIRVPAALLGRLADAWDRLQNPPSGHSLDRIRDEANDAVEDVLGPYRQALAENEHSVFFNSASNLDAKYAGI